MNLVIDTTALDKSLAAVTAIGNPVAVSALQDLTVGDNEPFQVLFTAGSAGIPSWVGTPGYTCTVGIGLLDVDGLANYCSAVLATSVAGGYSGTLSLTTQQLYDNLKLQVGSSVDWTRFPTNLRTPYARPYGAWMNMQITITDPSGNVVTYADLRFYLRVRVMPKNPGTTGTTVISGIAGGSIAATNGVSTQTVLFASTTLGRPFGNTCQAVIPTLIPPAGSSVFIDCWLTALPSLAGFSVEYGAPIPASGWTLSFIAAGT